MFALIGCGRYGFDPQEVATKTNPDATSGSPPDTKLDAPGIDGAIDAALPACAASYNLVAGTSKYRLGAASDSWLNAETACEADGVGMHLTVIANFVEQQKIENFLGAALAGWVGASDRKTDNVFLHVIGGGEPYLPWGAGYPSFVGPGCVILDPVARTYLDGDCTQSLPYVCECDQIPADPTSY
jgi:Lectin C-type domain